VAEISLIKMHFQQKLVILAWILSNDFPWPESGPSQFVSMREWLDASTPFGKFTGTWVHISP